MIAPNDEYRPPDRRRSASAGCAAASSGGGGDATYHASASSHGIGPPRPRTAGGAAALPSAAIPAPSAAPAAPDHAGALVPGSAPAWPRHVLQRQLSQLTTALSRVQQAHAGAKASAAAEAGRAEALAAENLEVSAQILQLDADLRAAEVWGSWIFI